MSTARRERGRNAAKRAASGSYFDRSRQPLEILALVAPLVVLYEVGLLYSLRGTQGTLTNAAHEGLFRFFYSFGIDATRLSLPTLALPAAVVVIVLLVWQILSRRPWTVHLPTVGGMALEGVMCAFPLLVVAQIISRVGIPATPDALGALDVFGKVTMSIGAGIYEELVFRMILLALLHAVLVDLFRIEAKWGTTIAVVGSAVLFALYHPLRDSTGVVLWQRAAFFAIAGLYFGVVYIVRGFGIAVGAHSAYDIAVVVFLGEA